jgi:hypothetical protein
MLADRVRQWKSFHFRLNHCRDTLVRNVEIERNGPVAQNEDSRIDHSIYLYRVLGQKLVSREAALAFAQLVFADRFGQGELHKQMPFTVDDGGDTWIVRGSRMANFDDGQPLNSLRRGKGEVIISQTDGRILKLTVDGVLQSSSSSSKDS